MAALMSFYRKSRHIYLYLYLAGVSMQRVKFRNDTSAYLLSWQSINKEEIGDESFIRIKHHSQSIECAALTAELG